MFFPTFDLSFSSSCSISVSAFLKPYLHSFLHIYSVSCDIFRFAFTESFRSSSLIPLLRFSTSFRFFILFLCHFPPPLICNLLVIFFESISLIIYSFINFFSLPYFRFRFFDVLNFIASPPFTFLFEVFLAISWINYCHHPLPFIYCLYLRNFCLHSFDFILFFYILHNVCFTSDNFRYFSFSSCQTLGSRRMCLLAGRFLYEWFVGLDQSPG